MAAMQARARSVLLLTLVAAATACTPALDWREVRLEGAGLVALFPCKPERQVRRVPLAGVIVEMSLWACSAGGATYAVGVADVGDPQRVVAALDELAASAARNIGSMGPLGTAPLRVTGMTPNAQARRETLAGQMADGSPIQERLAVFARGGRVYQATIVGTRLDDEAVAMYFSALRLPT
jgi:hypothetical protein